MSDVPSATNVSRRSISAVASPYSRKQSHSSTSCELTSTPAANAARKAAPSDSLGESERAQCESDCIERLVIAANSEPRSHLFEQDDSEPSDQRAECGPEEEEPDDAARDIAALRCAGCVSNRDDRENDNREKHDVVHSGFDSQCDSRDSRKCPRPEDTAQKNWISRSQCCAKYRGRCPGHIEKESRGDGDEYGWNERAGTEQSPEELFSPADFSYVDRYCVAEEDESEREHRESMQRGRFEPDVDESQTVRAENGAEAERTQRRAEIRFARARPREVRRRYDDAD